MSAYDLSASSLINPPSPQSPQAQKRQNAMILFRAKRLEELTDSKLDKKTIKGIVSKEWIDMPEVGKEKWRMMARELNGEGDEGVSVEPGFVKVKVPKVVEEVVAVPKVKKVRKPKVNGPEIDFLGLLHQFKGELDSMRRDLEQTKSDLEQTKSDLEQTKGELKSVKKDLKKSKETADALALTVQAQEQKITELEGGLVGSGLGDSGELEELEGRVARIEKENIYNTRKIIEDVSTYATYKGLNHSEQTTDKKIWYEDINKGEVTRLEKLLDEGMNPLMLLGSAALSNLIVSTTTHPEKTDEVCAFITRFKTNYRIKLTPINNEMSYIQQALVNGLPKIARCLYDLGCEFDNTLPPSYSTAYPNFLSYMLQVPKNNPPKYSECLALTHQWLA